MKNKRFITVLILTLSLILLTACDGKENSIKKESLTIEDIRYERGTGFLENDVMYIDTNQETFVLNPGDAEIKKTNKKESYLIIEKQKVKRFFKHTTVIKNYLVYISKNDISKVSRNYAENFKRTLEFD